MQAGRRAINVVVQDKPVVDGELIMGEFARQVKADAEAKENVLAVAKTLGYEGSLTPDSLEEGIRESLARVNYETFTIGARLLLLKEQCAHGEFAERCERLEIEGSMARRLMMVSHKFANRATSHDLAKLGKSKLFELAILDDDEATAFAEGESVRGVTHDDAAKLSVKALREKIREYEERIKAKDRVAADNQGALQRLQEQLAGKKPAPAPTPEFIADSALRDLDNESLRLMGLIEASMRSFLVKVAAPELELGDLLRQQAIRAAVGRILAATHQLAQDFDVPVSGPGAAHENGESDAVWDATLNELDSGDDHVSGS